MDRSERFLAAAWRCLPRQLVELLAAWWRADAIRVSPREGRLLRMSPGTLLRVSGQVATVVARRLCQRSDGPVVVYDVVCNEQPCELRVRLSLGRQSPKVQWCEKGQRAWLAADAVEVYG